MDTLKFIGKFLIGALAYCLAVGIFHITIGIFVTNDKTLNETTGAFALVLFISIMMKALWDAMEM
jgi:hypothetical protein